MLSHKFSFSYHQKYRNHSFSSWAKLICCNRSFLFWSIASTPRRKGHLYTACEAFVIHSRALANIVTWPGLRKKSPHMGFNCELRSLTEWQLTVPAAIALTRPAWVACPARTSKESFKVRHHLPAYWHAAARCWEQFFLKPKLTYILKGEQLEWQRDMHTSMNRLPSLNRLTGTENWIWRLNFHLSIFFCFLS